MKLLTAEQIKKLDEATIRDTPISSIDLMERAATRCVEWINLNHPNATFSILCGTGNNGGDGLAMARILLRQNRRVECYVLGDCTRGSTDFGINLQRFESLDNAKIFYLNEANHLLSIPSEHLIVDAIIGTGLSRKIEGWRAEIVRNINQLPNYKMAVDIPSGLFAEQWKMAGVTAVKAQDTLTFQMPKLSFLFRENHEITGNVHLLDIGLRQQVWEDFKTPFYLTGKREAQEIIQPPKTFQHKGELGFLSVFAGGSGMQGSAILTSLAALKSGVGLTQLHAPSSLQFPLMAHAPEALFSSDSNKNIISKMDVDGKTTACAIGPGIGRDSITKMAFESFLSSNKLPTVLDADALNMLAETRKFEILNAPYVLTPHPKEFDRLFGAHHNSIDRFRTLQLKSQELGLVIVLKGAYTRVALPDGSVHFNSSGNPGLAKGGSGDVLTGIIGALLAQGYPPEEAAILGVYVHGSAGDFAKEEVGVSALSALDIIRHLPWAWKEIEAA